jgi:hypothetical protein
MDVHGRDEKFTQGGGKRKEVDSSEDLDIDRKIILKWIL